MLNRSGDDIVTGGAPEELSTRLLGAAGARVTGVGVDVIAAENGELDLDASTARIELSWTAGTARPVPAANRVPGRLYFPVASLNLATSSAGTRPRSFTSMPWALAHSRTSVVFGSPAAGLRAPRAGRRAAPPARRAALR